MVEKKKKKKRSPIGCLVAIVLFIIFIVYGVKMLKEGYDMAEKKLNRESFDPINYKYYK